MIKKPMLSGVLSDPKSLKFPILASPKLDGIRCLVIDGKAVTRKFKPIPNHHIRTTIEAHYPSGVDGEILIQDKTFNEIQSLVMSEDGEPEFIYALFDYVKDGLDKPYFHRILDFHLLDLNTLPGCSILFPKLIQNHNEFLKAEGEYIKNGYEGIMVRSLEGPYKCGRSTEKEGYLLKYKRFTDSEAEIIGFEEKMHNNNEATIDELGHTKRSSHKDNLTQSGTLGTLIVRDIHNQVEFSIGTGFDDKMRQEIWNNRDSYLNKIVNYTYQSSGMLNKPRFPSFRGLRDKRDI